MFRLRRLRVFLLVFLPAAAAFCQRPYDIPVTAEYKNQPLPAILADLEKQCELRIFYPPDRIPVYKMSLLFHDETLKNVLQTVLSGSGMRVTNLGESRIIIAPTDQMNRKYIDSLVVGWESGRLQSPLLQELLEEQRILGASNLALNERAPVRLQGIVADGGTGEPVIGATLIVRELGVGTATDEQGKFQLDIRPGVFSILVEYVGYQSLLIKAEVRGSGEMNLEMNANPLQLSEVLIEAEAVQSGAKSTSTGLEKLSVQSLKELPVLLGEADVLKSLLYLPGISSVGEGSGGFNVRGGNVDQNLVLQDGVPLFNPSHALGFYSVFNADAVENITLYKGHVPAQFGGRLSSVLDVRLKDANRLDSKGSGSVGMISSKLVLEAPLVKEKFSVLFGGRQSYTGWMLRQVDNPSVNQSAARFGDLLLKTTWRLNQKTTLRAFGTFTDDYFRYARNFGYAWRNLQIGAQGDVLHSEHFSTQLSAAVSRYNGSQFDPAGADAFTLENGMNLLKFKLENLLLESKERHTLRFGAEVNLYETLPETIRPNSASTSILPKNIRRGGGREAGIFFQDDWKISPRLSLSAGLRWSIFQQTGAETVWQYDSEQPKEPATATDSATFAAGEVIETWQGAEPRLSGKYSLSETASVKASWNRLRQHVHLISNSAAPAPADLWLVSSRHLPPQVADQFSLGFYKNTGKGKWETSVEGWFKKIRNLPEYKDLPELLLNERLETELLQGKGKSWGAEFSVRKALGKWTGWFSYTWSQVRVKVDGRFAEETINGGKWYPASFDKPHQISLVARCQINPRNVFNLGFTYGSGRPVTAPVSYYTVNGITIPNYPERNSLRIRDYHRLDLSYTIDNSQAKVKGWRGSATFSIYNVYGRKNPFSVFFKADKKGLAKAYELSVLGSVMPALTYNFVF